MENLTEVIGKIRIDYFMMPRVQQQVNTIDRIICTSIGPTGVLLLSQVGLKDR